MTDDLIRRAEAALAGLDRVDALAARSSKIDLTRVRGLWVGEHIETIRAALKAQQPKPCIYCDDTGDVTALDGEWRGYCTCKAGQALKAQQPRESICPETETLCSRCTTSCEAQQPAPAGHVATVAEVHMSRYTIEWVNGPLPEGTRLYAEPAPVDAEGLPPLPEPDVAFDEGVGDIAWSEPLVRQAQREAQAVERERFHAIVANDAWAVTFQTFGQYRTALLKAIRQGAKT